MEGGSRTPNQIRQVMPPADSELGLALARTAPDKQDQDFLVAWSWLFSPPCTRSMARWTLMEGPVLGVLTSVKSLCLFLHL